jgi:hypothetical protein
MKRKSEGLGVLLKASKVTGKETFEYWSEL